jgi:hypothetical protein
MQVRRSVIVRVGAKEAEFDTLFDLGSTITLTSYEGLNELLGKVSFKKLARARWVVLASGRRMKVDAYFDAEVVIDKYMIEERIYLSKDMAREVIIEGRKVKLPDLVIGAPTMESWGIELDLKRGKVKSCREGFMLI